SPAASDSLVRVLTSPRWRIGPRDLVALGTRARGMIRGRPAASEQAGAGPGEGEDGRGESPRRGVQPEDHLSKAVADFTADSGSLVEALDDLGGPEHYSAE